MENTDRNVAYFLGMLLLVIGVMYENGFGPAAVVAGLLLMFTAMGHWYLTWIGVIGNDEED